MTIALNNMRSGKDLQMGDNEMIENLKMYTIEETAEILGVSKRTMMTYLKQKRIRAVKIGRRWKFTEQNIVDFVSGKKVTDE